jgi:hypothetical protein
MPVDEDDTQEQPVRERQADPNDAFDRALLAVQLECEQLNAAISNQDPEDAEIAAGDAVLSLLAAHSARQRIAFPATGDRARLHSTRFALRAKHLALVGLLDRATVQIVAPQLHGVLARLRRTLEIAEI